MRAKGGASRGVGFVCFTTRDDAMNATSRMNRTKLGKNNELIIVSEAYGKA